MAAIVTIAADGKATVKSKLDAMLAKGVAATVDFNPVAEPSARDGRRRNEPAGECR